MKTRHILAGLVALNSLSGCGAPKTPQGQKTPAPVATAAPSEETPAKPDSATPAAKVEFSAEDKAVADKMLATWENNRFDFQEVRKKENGRGMLFLASESTDKAQKVGALKAIREVYVDYENEKKLLVDEDYRKVILPLLRDPDKAIQQAAIEASYSVVRGDNPHPETFKTLIDLANNHPEASGRWEAASALSATTGKTKHPELVETFFKLYQDEPFVAGSAIKWTPIDFKQKDELRERTLAVLKELAKHENYVVRGRAVAKYGMLSKDKAETIKLAKEMLKDSEPFVVAEALRVLGETKDESLILTIAEHLDDSRENTTKMAFPKLNGETINSSLGSLTGYTVADTATSALDKLTDGRPDKGFEASKVGYGKTKDDDIAKNVAAAKAWVAENK